MKPLFLFLFAMQFCIVKAEKDSTRSQNKFYPGNFFAIGFSDRLNKPSDNRFNIQYYNQGKTVNDTFYFNNNLISSSHLVNFVMSGAVSNRFIGAKFDLGFVPFANRNSHQSVSAFGLISLNERVALSPIFGYTRLRKQKLIGTFTGKDDKITFMDKEYSEVKIRVHEVVHSYHYGLGAFICLDEDFSLYLECRYNKIFRNTPRIKVSAFSQDGGETFLESIISADQYDRFSHGDKEVYMRNANNTPLSGFYAVGNLAFTVQLAIRITGSSGNGYYPKKFMGAQ